LILALPKQGDERPIVLQKFGDGQNGRRKKSRGRKNTPAILFYPERCEGALFLCNSPQKLARENPTVTWQQPKDLAMLVILTLPLGELLPSTVAPW